jgi:putative transcription factor
LIEGARLTVCHECSKHGEIIYEEPKPKTALLSLTGKHPAPNLQIRKRPETTVDTSIELVGGFGEKIRQAREKIGLSHEDFGKKLNAKVSLLKKIETGKMTPDNKLATRMERVLKIKLIAPASEEKVPQVKPPKLASHELTLGDLIQFDDKGKRKQEDKERKPS